jgi:hypothetical protein
VGRASDIRYRSHTSYRHFYSGANKTRRRLRKGMSRGVLLSLTCICVMLLLIIQLFFVYGTRHRWAFRRDFSPPSTNLQPSLIHGDMLYEIFMVPTFRTIVRFDHWAIRLTTVNGAMCSFGMWTNFSTNPVSLYLTCPDVYHLEMSRRLNIASSSVEHAETHTGKPMHSYLTGIQDFVGRLNPTQREILHLVLTSPICDSNGVRLLPLRATFAFLSLESVFMPLLGVKGYYGDALNCQLLCSYFHQQPNKLLAIINRTKRISSQTSPTD